MCDIITVGRSHVHHNRRKLEFDPDKLVVDDLREELRLRGLTSSGSKSVLLQRLQEAVATRPDIALERLVFREPVTRISVGLSSAELTAGEEAKAQS